MTFKCIKSINLSVPPGEIQSGQPISGNFQHFYTAQRPYNIKKIRRKLSLQTRVSLWGSLNRITQDIHRRHPKSGSVSYMIPLLSLLNVDSSSQL